MIDQKKTVVVAVTGASGVVVGLRLMEQLRDHDISVIGIVSHHAIRVIEHELGSDYAMPQGIEFYDESDASAPINSSSHPAASMIIAPCSMKTLSAIAHGYTANLITRAADNQLRTGRQLILAPRETPLSIAHLENMLILKRAGAIIFPLMIAYYHHPNTITDITDFLVGKILDLLNIPNDLYQRWGSIPIKD
ncbi:MAG: UbiX family flavin prenyltransferase [candidate division KSB1 bacterium]|nr:UbiX family flavin prenyltransferase [candidate division KSB1 bacterium]MDZ7336478.1 UbiX family flavin prenyltransferase [candidate division KSB1 bacterium]MDZ7357257.1 UbiX family flavin prenyltransferase [candidate division KSB1 bacterium]MDZ7377059.1 UbiX family flavin prenyltransferase [candidate division KSB1 bacterium]MDZ7402115.1 UbiX family flavin prenyltransferase [candidate division KSB1 bacterium]